MMGATRRDIQRGRNNEQRRRAARSTPARRRLRVEALEDRRMLSIDSAAFGSVKELLALDGPLASVGELGQIWADSQGLMPAPDPTATFGPGKAHMQLNNDNIIVMAVAKTEGAQLLADLEALGLVNGHARGNVVGRSAADRIDRRVGRIGFTRIRPA